MPIENDDPFSKLSEQGGFDTSASANVNKGANDYQENISLFSEANSNLEDPEHSDSHNADQYGKGGGHISGEEDDPEKDALAQYLNSVGGWFLAGNEDKDSGGKINQNQNNNNNQNQPNNLNPIQQEQLRHQQNMNRLEETNKGLQTSKNMINTFQDNVSSVTAINPNVTQLVKDTQKELRTYLEEVKNQLLLEVGERVKSTPEEADEAFIKLNWLKVNIRKDQELYEGYEKKAKKWALIFRLLSSMLAAVVTVLLGLNITDYMKSLGIDWFVNFFALIISAFISIIGVIQGFYDVNELYIKYTDTANKLKEMEKLIEFLELSRNYLTIRQVNLLFKAYHKIINSTDDYETLVSAERDSGSK